jgi:hypothetical protein
MKADPVIDEIRKVRDEISRECGYEPRRLVSYYKLLQKEQSATGKKPRSAKKPLARRS